MPTTLVVATINTQTGKLLEQLDGLELFARKQVDILLLQEVFGTHRDTLAHRLAKYGYQLAASDKSTGLAIALHQRSHLAEVKDSNKIIITQKKGPLSNALTRYSIVPEHHLRARGLLSIDLRTPSSGILFTVATTHPTVFIRHKSRIKHLRSLQNHLENNYTSLQPLILGADMNHYPCPGREDIMFRRLGQFNEVPINGTTWLIEGTKYEWLARIASTILRRPFNTFDGQLDTILYRGNGLRHIRTRVADIKSDHRAIISYFSL